ncbi:hypothetical protein MAR_033896 [Mya arenaria]|uniref:Uncharacterized protein n=1 Tax=Mya arenaria TaxID=6604 RepID=A0ABY7GCW2_MYAAR|nr:hypothetical protein MAR_033896 [Mya arenaria]
MEFANSTSKDQKLVQIDFVMALAVSRGMAFRTSLHMTDEQMNCNLHIFESLLTDTNCLKERKATKEALETIQKIRTNAMSTSSDLYERMISKFVNWLRREQAKLSLFVNHLNSMRKEITDGNTDKSEPLRKKPKTSHTRQLRSADSSNEYSSASETTIIDKDIHKWFSVYIHACTDVRETNKTTDSLLSALGITNIADGNREFVPSSADSVRLIFMIDHTTMDLKEIFHTIRQKVDGGCRSLSLSQEITFSTIYIGSRQSIQMKQFKRCSNVGRLFYGLHEDSVQNSNKMVFDVTNTNDTNVFIEKLDDLLERIAMKAIQKKTEALVLLKSQVCENTENKRSYEFIESELTKLGLSISRNMDREEVSGAKTSTSGTVYKLRSIERTFFQKVASQKSQIDQQLCSLKALYARNGVPEDEKPTFPEENISGNIKKVNAVEEY